MSKTENQKIVTTKDMTIALLWQSIISRRLKTEKPKAVEELEKAGVKLETYEEPNSYPDDRNMA